MTDADVVLGMIDPALRRRHDRARSRPVKRALERGVGDRIGLSTETAAYAVHEMVSENMASAARVHRGERTWAEEEPEAAKDSVITPAVPHPSAVPGPRKADAEPADSSAASADTEPWGRVDDDGTVSVREADGWRVVGQYPDGTAEEALAYYRRKFSDLASEVALLEVRHRRGGAPAADLRSTAKALHAKLQDAAAVGNLAALDARVLALTVS